MVMLIRKHRVVAHTLERAFEREDLAIRDSEPLPHRPLAGVCEGTLSVSVSLSLVPREVDQRPLYTAGTNSSAWVKGAISPTR